MTGPVGLTPFVSDPDFTLYVGDVREVLAALPDGSVDCCVTSPPYWGLRDYGTGTWSGGDEGCDHARPTTNMNNGFNERWGQGAGERKQERKSEGQYAQTCAKCGAVRTDSQIGLEETPAAFVEEMVAVFREVRRVLADHGTLWLNLGDSYTSGGRDWRSPDTKGGSSGDARAMDVRPDTPIGLKPKDLVGVPWRVAFALQADGWYLRSDIIWSKPNPMPESVTDRPTKAHEYVFLLAKSPRYFFDQEAVREGYKYDGRKVTTREAGEGSHPNHRNGKRERWPGIGKSSHGARAEMTAHGHDESEPMDINHGGRNVRSVWEIATQPYPEAHFATFPEALPERCIKAGCPTQVCATCGVPRERLTDISYTNPGNRSNNGKRSGDSERDKGVRVMAQGKRLEKQVETTGWTDCGHDNWRAGVVLDPFMGSGTTALVARNQGRHSIGVELNPEYAALCARRLQQLSLFAEPA